MRRPNGYWKDENNLVAEARAAMQEHSWETLPVHRVLYENGLSSLCLYAAKFHGGLTRLRELLGQKNLKRSSGLWQSEDYIIEQAKLAMQENKWETLPGSHILQENGYSSLCLYAGKFHGGLIVLRKLLGQEILHSPNGCRKDKDFILGEAKQAMQEHGWDTLPSQKVLCDHGYGPLAKGAKYHGGMAGLRKLLGQKKLKHPNGSWNDPDFLMQEAQSAMQEQGWTKLPSRKIVRKNGYGSIVQAASVHGGMNYLRKLLGEKSLRVADGSWKDPDFIVAQSREAMKQNGWVILPNPKVLRSMGYGRIINASYRHHGGMSGLRKLIAKSLDQPTEQEQLEVLVGGYDA